MKLKVAVLLSGSGWLQRQCGGSNAKKADGTPCRFNDPDAAKWTLMGAISKVTESDDMDRDFHRAIAIAAKAIVANGWGWEDVGHYETVQLFGASRPTKHENVLKVARIVDLGMIGLTIGDRIMVYRDSVGTLRVHGSDEVVEEGESFQNHLLEATVLEDGTVKINA